MNISLTINSESAAEMLQVLQALSGRGAEATPVKASRKSAPEIPASTPAEEFSPATEIADTSGTSTPAANASTSSAGQERITIEKIRLETTAKLTAGKKAGVKALLKEFEAANVSSLDPKHFEAYMQKLNEL